MQKGYAQLFLVIALLILIGFGIYIYPKIKADRSIQIQNYNPLKKQSQNYSNQNLGFTFQYSSGLTVKEDTEQEFNKRGGGDFRKNFKGYVGYEPAKFLEALVVLDSKASYDTNPFAIWVFDNPNKLTIDEWYKQYWYYPFVWGDFTYQGKFELAPKQDATVSGQLGKSGIIDYQPGKPKFVYISQDGKMYLFRIIGESGEKILSTFNFTNSKSGVCVQVITPAKNPQTGECKNFPTPCQVPDGWQNVRAC